MRNVQRLLMICLPLVVLMLAACQSDKKSSPSQLDAPFEQGSLPLPGTSQPTLIASPLPPTFTPTPRASATQRATITPYPTPHEEDATDEPLDNYVLPGDWLYQTFKDETGTDRTLEEFLGRAVVIHTLSASCEACVEQQQYLLAAIKGLYELRQLTDTVFLVLGVEQEESPSLINSVLKSQLGEDWAVVELLLRDDVEADWVIGVAGDDLLAALERDFGPDVSDPEALTIIVVEPDGLAHLTREGMVDTNELRDAISFYSNPPPGIEE